MGRLDLCPEISLTHSHQGGTGGKGTSGGPGPGTRAKALPPADMKQGLLSVGIGGRESRSGCLDVEKGESRTPIPLGPGRDRQGLMQPDVPPSPTDCSITKFLNRILGLEVHKQNALFQYFSDTFDHLIEVDKREGKYDMGILGKCQWRAGPTRHARQEHQGPEVSASKTQFRKSADCYLTVPRAAMQRGAPKGTLRGRAWHEWLAKRGWDPGHQLLGRVGAGPLLGESPLCSARD